jgi:tRNA modification GTPase
MVVFHPGPRSYTGEDLVEISCHGNPLVVDGILELIAATGLARLAHRGEFTRRAFLNRKMDLLQAEAVGALIGSTSATGCDMARSLLKGELSHRVGALQDALTGIIADIESSFIMDGEGIETKDIRERILPVKEAVDSLLQGAQDSARLYAGISTTIAGAPNVGKSSLFNAIIGSDRAIVHHEEGTTRDVIREHLLIDGVDFIFHDTAGIRETASGPEQMGIEKTLQALASCDLLIYVVDSRQGVAPFERRWLSQARRTIVALNKIDLLEGEPVCEYGYETVPVSARLGTGVRDLMAAMARVFSQDRPRVFLDRHILLLRKAGQSLDSCLSAAREGLTPDVMAMDIRQAARVLSLMTGENQDKDILEQVFSRFCVGK